MLEFATTDKSDTTELGEHLETCWRKTYTPIFGETVVNAMMKTLLPDILQKEDEITYIARLDGKIVGCVMIAERGDKAYLWGMYVSPNFQRKGLGEKLLELAVRTPLNAQSIHLLALKSSKDAVSFYRKNGFVVDKETEIDWTHLNRAGAFEMSRQIEPQAD